MPFVLVHIVFGLLLLTSAGTPLAARADAAGIGFAQAEEGAWWCRGNEPGKALACALDKCKAGAGRQECVPTRWCSLSGWSGLMVIWLPEHHSTTILCGAASEAAATEALKALCANDEVVTRCDLILLIDPDGREKQIEGISWPGPTVREPGDDASTPAE